MHPPLRKKSAIKSSPNIQFFSPFGSNIKENKKPLTESEAFENYIRMTQLALSVSEFLLKELDLNKLPSIPLKMKCIKY